MAALIACVYFLWIPNPNIILLSGLVVCSSLFGYPGGVTAGVFMLGYTLFFFSTDNDFVTFTTTNFQKVLVSVLGIVADILIVCHLKSVESRSYRRLEKLTELLREKNRLLEKASLTDPLTELGNRFALHRSFPRMQDRDIAVMMMDVDNFKSLNDVYGHGVGDACLRATAKRLAGLFGEENAFRIGGDEFVVLCADSPRDSFDENVQRLLRTPPAVEGQAGLPLGYSAGYVYGHCGGDGDLELMIKQADEELYRSKESGKGRSSFRIFRPAAGPV